VNSEDIVQLMDWKHRIFDLYGSIRASSDPLNSWERWVATRRELFVGHPQSPVPAGERETYEGPFYFDYDSAYRVLGVLRDAEPAQYDIATSGGTTYGFTRFATASFEVGGSDATLEVYWLDGYGGGIFLPFRDGTAGKETYGAGRYLFDTVKGADLGMEGDSLVLDFNFAYNPSCSYDPRWVCPLAPPPNRLDVVIPAGEKHTEK
jgi:uncharacterized protein (DUF1684 family)